MYDLKDGILRKLPTKWKADLAHLRHIYEIHPLEEVRKEEVTAIDPATGIIRKTVRSSIDLPDV